MDKEMQPIAIEDKHKVPSIITREERIVRGIFSPLNLTTSGGLRPNSFTLRENIDKGVSVIRLTFAGANTCKKHCLSIQNKEKRRSYAGLAILLAGSILDSHVTPGTLSLNVKETDKTRLKAEIYYFVENVHYYPVKDGRAAPFVISMMIDNLISRAKFFKDEHADSDEWKGVDLLKVDLL